MKRKFLLFIISAFLFSQSVFAVTYIKLFHPDGQVEDFRDVKILETKPMYVEFATSTGSKVIFSGSYKIFENFR